MEGSAPTTVPSLLSRSPLVNETIQFIQVYQKQSICCSHGLRMTKIKCKCTHLYFNPFFRFKSSIVPLLLWEVPRERLTIMEELGRGAYGKVHKGVMKELPKKEVFFKPREERVDMGEGRVVAVKVVLGEKILHVIFKVYCPGKRFFLATVRDKRIDKQKERRTEGQKYCGMCYLKMVI